MGAQEIIGVIEEGLTLLNKLVPDHATRIADKIKGFKERWDVEYAKGPIRDDNLLDHIELELFDIRGLYSDAIKAAALKSG